ncbi:PRMT5 arginine-N-methyltransferase-domain-containing protein [Lipomyces japonicus]|uniref:PRMT5 arginine-N-methyltransferase-domain-containing protein n=1 Tax=Lipomyces japonicus TaxID=56871 RepID=UPI0034CDC702
MAEESDSKSEPAYFVGLQPDSSPLNPADSDTVLSAVSNGYDVLSIPITNQNFRARVSRVTLAEAVSLTITPPTLTEVNILPNTNYTQHVFGLAARWLEFDSNDSKIANVSAQVLIHELAYASFCGLSFVVVPGPKRRSNVAQYAQALNSALTAVPYVNIVVHLAMTESSEEENLPSSIDSFSIWEIWNTVRTICDYSSRLTVGLEVPTRLPQQSLVSRWFAEPVTALFISANVFLTNSNNFPVLPKAHQFFIFKYMKIRPYIILHDVREATAIRSKSSSSSSSSSQFAKDELAYLLYIRHLHAILPEPSPIEKFSEGYWDYLQNPLQPLSDNLESGTYQSFEKDPVKYAQYEKAIYKALRDKRSSGTKITLAVLGAGRGPLVDRALKAAGEAQVSIHIYAIEKNQNAYIYLQQRKLREWKSNVELIFTDMRSWTPQNKVDIIVSELLGSFADNELSPECLDGAQHVLKSDGIMIPQSYSAHFIPAFSPKIYSSLKFQNKFDVHNSPYVVMLQAVDLLGDSIHKAWDFVHPSKFVSVSSKPDGLGIGINSSASNEHNVRNTKGRFTVEHRGVIHGFAGYFESVLYDDIELSTRPDTINKKSKDMISWFPIWFPIRTPLYVPDDSEIEISIWRRTDNRKLWYEWVIETFAAVPDLSGRNSLASTDSGLSSRRIRLGSSGLHNSGGKHSSMLL